MKNKFKSLLFIGFTIIVAFNLNAQQNSYSKTDKLPVIALEGIKNITGLAVMDNAALLIDKALITNLNLTEHYSAVKVNNDDIFDSIEKMQSYCEGNNCSYILYGSITKNSKDIIIGINLYSFEKKEVILSTKEITQTPSKLRFSLEKVLTDVFCYLLDKDVSFASVSFVNMKHEEGSYSVFVDSVNAGKKVEYIDYLLSGKRNIRIIQNRLGKEYILADIDLLVLPGDRVSMEFEMPALLEKEKRILRRYEKTIENHIDNKFSSYKTGESFKTLFRLLEDPSFSAEAVEKKNYITGQYEKWKQNMEEWGLERGLSTADLPYSLGIKAATLISSNTAESWDTAGADPDTKSRASNGGGFFGSAALTDYAGIQGEFILYNQKTSTEYDAGYPLANPSISEESAWFVEFPLIVYFRIPSYLLKFYAGYSLKYRVSEIFIDLTDNATGETSSTKYDEELLRMGNSGWLAGGSLEIPLGSNVFFFDFRYNRNLYSWFESSAPESGFISSYITCSTGYTFKTGKPQK